MAIELPKDLCQQAIASIERCFQDERDERIRQRVAEVDIDHHEQPIGYWARRNGNRSGGR